MNELTQGRAADLAYESQGDGELLLLVHGFPLDRSMWKAQRASLSDAYRVIVPDLRGFGKSTPWDSSEPLTMARHADDLAAMLDALDIGEPIYLAGLSMGGYVGLEFWRRHGQRLRGLALLDTKAAGDSEEARTNREQAAVAAETAGKADDLALDMVPRLLSGDSLSNPDLAEALEQTRQVMASTSPQTFAAAQRGMAVRDDFDAALEKIEVPCLVLCGSEDSITPPGVMQPMAERLPNARYVELSGAGHLTPIEQPAAVNQALREWATPRS